MQLTPGLGRAQSRPSASACVQSGDHHPAEKACQLKPGAMSIRKTAMEELGPSARAHDKVLRVARTIAYVEGCDEIKPQHIAEAVEYRSLDRSVWV
jgi:predicted ATPase with chaperone activity